MIEFTKEMALYEEACRKLEKAEIAYIEMETIGYKVTFKLTKDGFSANTIIDFNDTYVEEAIDNAIAAFLNFVEWNKQEQARQERKQKRARKC